MRKRTLPGEVNYSSYRDKKGLHIVNNNPARGTESRHITKSKDPHSSLANQSLSEQAKALKQARGDNAEAYEWLLQELVININAMAKNDNWKIQFDPLLVAQHVLDPYIGKEVSKREAAKKFKRDLKSYRTAWEPKLITIEKWVKAWNAELNRRS